MQTERRVYPLDNKELTEEQIAVVFAMTSRSPEPFDEIATKVSEERAAGFHERWVLDYGHASVAEHAIVHLAVENISRLACDTLEDNRLASYTEKSSRYQIIDREAFYVPVELNVYPVLKGWYIRTCQSLFDTYHELLKSCISMLREKIPTDDEETDRAYDLRIRRMATDGCRAVLPASTLTNVGMTANARSLEHAISKLLSSHLMEIRSIGADILDEGRSVTPTLIKYAQENPFLQAHARTEQHVPVPETSFHVVADFDPDAERKIASAILYRKMGYHYREDWHMDRSTSMKVIEEALDGIGPHDSLPREFEMADYTFVFTMDYGALREFRRHRMQTYIAQPLTIAHGLHVPPVVRDAGLEDQLRVATNQVDVILHEINDVLPQIGQYLVTHGHLQQILTKMNIRECYHFFKLRTSARAHESIRTPMLSALEQVKAIHPHLWEALGI